jgi:competence CoiA-like predicted nuclease
MRYANWNGVKISAEDYDKSSKTFFDELKCRCCNTNVIAKQGDIKIWHFSHESKNSCSEWHKPMSEWHKNWQNEFDKEFREIIHHGKLGKHIADVKTKHGHIIEFQNSPISSKEILQREEFYGDKLLWILNSDTFKLELNSEKNNKKKYEIKFSELFKILFEKETLEIQDFIFAKSKYSIYNSINSFFKISKCKNVYIDMNDGNLLKLQRKGSDYNYILTYHGYKTTIDVNFKFSFLKTNMQKQIKFDNKDVNVYSDEIVDRNNCDEKSKKIWFKELDKFLFCSLISKEQLLFTIKNGFLF